jgi:hypothetical protein
MLAPLHAQGLDEISVSTDPAHQAFVPVAFAENALNAANDLGIVSEVVGVFWDPKARVEGFVKVPEGTRKLTRLALPRGPSRDRKVTPADYCLSADRFLACRGFGTYDFTVYPDGQLYPCCSGGSNIQGGLAVGNLRQEPLAELVARSHAYGYTRIVMSLGIACLYELAAHRFPDLAAQLPDREPYLSCCDLCAQVHGDARLRELIAPVVEYAERMVEPMRELAGLHCERPEVIRG